MHATDLCCDAPRFSIGYKSIEKWLKSTVLGTLLQYSLIVEYFYIQP